MTQGGRRLPQNYGQQKEELRKKFSYFPSFLHRFPATGRHEAGWGEPVPSDWSAPPKPLAPRPPQIHATRQREAELPIRGAYWASRIEDGTEMTVM